MLLKSRKNKLYTWVLLGIQMLSTIFRCTFIIRLVEMYLYQVYCVCFGHKSSPLIVPNSMINDGVTLASSSSTKDILSRMVHSRVYNAPNDHLFCSKWNLITALRTCSVPYCLGSNNAPEIREIEFIVKAIEDEV